MVAAAGRKPPELRDETIAIMSLAAGLFPHAREPRSGSTSIAWDAPLSKWSVDQVCTVLEGLAKSTDKFPTLHELSAALHTAYPRPTVTPPLALMPAESADPEGPYSALWREMERQGIPWSTERLTEFTTRAKAIPLPERKRFSRLLRDALPTLVPTPLPPVPITEGGSAEARALVARWRAGERWDKTGMSQELRDAMKFEWQRVLAEEETHD